MQRYLRTLTLLMLLYVAGAGARSTSLGTADEFKDDSRYDVWNKTRFGGGVQLALKPRTIDEDSFTRAPDSFGYLLHAPARHALVHNSR